MSCCSMLAEKLAFLTMALVRYKVYALHPRWALNFVSTFPAYIASLA